MYKSNLELEFYLEIKFNLEIKFGIESDLT